jgi:hypothetical protein
MASNLMVLFWAVGLILTPHPCTPITPVVLDVTYPTECQVTADCFIEQPTGNPNVYRWVCPCQPVGEPFLVWMAERQTWTRWPECGGSPS